MSIANQTAGDVNVDELDACQCHLGNSWGTPDLHRAPECFNMTSSELTFSVILTDDPNISP